MLLPAKGRSPPCDGTIDTTLALQRGIEKLKKLLENEPEESFTAQEYMTLYT